MALVGENKLSQLDKFMSSIRDHQLKTITVSTIYLDPVTNIAKESTAFLMSKPNQPMIIHTREQLGKMLIDLFVKATSQYQLNFEIEKQNPDGN